MRKAFSNQRPGIILFKEGMNVGKQWLGNVMTVLQLFSYFIRLKPQTCFKVERSF